jgi:putative phage-type endonuclease
MREEDAVTRPRLTLAAEPRTARLGASEVAAVLGLSPYRTPFGVWASKTQAAEPEPETASQRRGRILEPALLDWLREEVGALEVSRETQDAHSPWVVSPDWPHLGCHPDGVLRWADGREAGAEIKTARHGHEWGETADAIPPAYAVQVQVCLALVRVLPEWRLGAYLPVRDELRAYTVLPWAPDLVRELLQRAEDWWRQHVQADCPPPIDGSEDARRWLLSRYPGARTALREASPEEVDLVRALARARDAARAAEAELGRLESRVKQAIGDAEGVALPNGRATWKMQESSRVDVTRLRAEQPDLAARYSTTQATRVLRVSLQEDKT